MTLNKFQIMGDMNHRPTVFHLRELNKYVRPDLRKTAYAHLLKFLLEDRQPWTLMVITFFETKEGIETYPTSTVVPDTNGEEMAGIVESFIAESLNSAIETEGYTVSQRKFYAYYLNFGGDLNLDHLEEQLTTRFLQVTQDLTAVNPDHIEVCNRQKLIEALAFDMDRFTQRKHLPQSGLVEQKEEQHAQASVGP